MYVLVFTGGSSPDHEVLYRELNPLVEADAISFYIAADSGLDTIIRLNSEWEKMPNHLKMEPDLVLGDMDSVQNSSFTSVFPNAQFIPFPVDKDYTDTELALEKAKTLFPEAKIILVGGDGGRIDHLFQIIDDFNMGFHPDQWLLSQEKVVYLEPENQYEIKGLGERDNVSFLRPASSWDRGFVESRGLVWEGELFRKTGMASVSNRRDSFKGETVSITVREAPFLLVVPYGATVSLCPGKCS